MESESILIRLSLPQKFFDSTEERKGIGIESFIANEGTLACRLLLMMRQD